MAYHFPPDVDQLVKEQMATSAFSSEDDVLRHALLLFREIKARQQQLIAEVQIGIDQADRGLTRQLDVEALIERCTRQLAEEGIVD